MLATIVDTEALLKTIVAAFIGGVGVTLIFSLAIWEHRDSPTSAATAVRRGQSPLAHWRRSRSSRPSSRSPSASS